MILSVCVCVYVYVCVSHTHQVHIWVVMYQQQPMLLAKVDSRLKELVSCCYCCGVVWVVEQQTFDPVCTRTHTHTHTHIRTALGLFK